MSLMEVYAIASVVTAIIIVFIYFLIKKGI